MLQATSNAFVEKLRGYVPLTQGDVALLEAACAHQRVVPARRDLIREGDKPGPVFIILEGWACRYKLVPGGGRQITAFMMPGDFCDIHVAVLDQMDHSIATLSKVRVATVQRAEMEQLIETRPAITRAFWKAQLVDEGVLRAWIVSMGRRNSVERVAHLVSELYVRAHNIGQAGDGRFEMPVSQIALADALGLTPVHINRVLGRLRAAGIMDLAKGKLIISNITQLARIAGFDDAYLHRRLRGAA